MCGTAVDAIVLTLAHQKGTTAAGANNNFSLRKSTCFVGSEESISNSVFNIKVYAEAVRPSVDAIYTWQRPKEQVLPHSLLTLVKNVKPRIVSDHNYFDQAMRDGNN